MHLKFFVFVKLLKTLFIRIISIQILTHLFFIIAEIESDFKKCLSLLVPMLLAPENLVVKQISGHKVKAKELVQYFKSYIKMYKGNELPEPKSMLMVSLNI